MKSYIIGDNPPKEIKQLNSEDMMVTGYVKDLTPYFENCKLSVSPLRYGAGVKGKINQSNMTILSSGEHTITTTIPSRTSCDFSHCEIVCSDDFYPAKKTDSSDNRSCL